MQIKLERHPGYEVLLDERIDRRRDSKFPRQGWQGMTMKLNLGCGDNKHPGGNAFEGE